MTETGHSVTDFNTACPIVPFIASLFSHPSPVPVPIPVVRVILDLDIDSLTGLCPGDEGSRSYDLTTPCNDL